MTKQDYMNALSNALRKHGVADSDDIMSEYEQHFLFKLADGFKEEEIAAKLGDPETIATQFAGIRQENKTAGGKKFFLALWLTFIGVFEVMLYGAFAAFIAGVFCGSLVPAALGVEFIAGINFMNILPPMPYGGAVIFGITLIALGVLLFLFALYCFAYLRQMIRASLRWRKNLMRGETLPLLPMSPQFSSKTRRGLRSVFLGSLMVFGIAFVLGFAILALYTHSWGFWHALGWFGYPPTVY